MFLASLKNQLLKRSTKGLLNLGLDAVEVTAKKIHKYDDAVKTFKKTRGIYVIHFEDGTKYVGQSKNVGSRLRQHFHKKSKFGREGQYTNKKVKGVEVYETPDLKKKRQREFKEQEILDLEGGLDNPNILNDQNPVSKNK